MAETMQFDLVSPEARIVSGEAVSVQIPGSDGDMTAMVNHAPVMTTLRPGLLRAEMTSGVEEFVVFGGFADVGPEGTSVLAERAMAKSDVSREILDAEIERARRAEESADDETVAVAAKLVSDLEALGAEIGL